jgi:hypothetical protein
MSDSADAKNVGILADRNRQAGEDRVAERVASAVSEATRYLHRQLEALGLAAEAERRAEMPLGIYVERALEVVYELWCKFGREAREAGAGAPSAEAYGHDIAQSLRRVFGDACEPATLKACVELLQLADARGVAPHEFSGFLREVGGVAAWTSRFEVSSDEAPPRSPVRRRSGKAPRMRARPLRRFAASTYDAGASPVSRRC